MSNLAWLFLVIIPVTVCAAFAISHSGLPMRFMRRRLIKQLDTIHLIRQFARTFPVDDAGKAALKDLDEAETDLLMAAAEVGMVRELLSRGQEPFVVGADLFPVRKKESLSHDV